MNLPYWFLKNRTLGFFTANTGGDIVTLDSEPKFQSVQHRATLTPGIDMPVTHSSFSHVLYETGKQEFKNRWMPRDVSSSWKNKLGMCAWSLNIAKNKTKKTKQTNRRTKRTQKGSECISKREFWHFLDYRLDWSCILHISLFQLQQHVFPFLSSNLRKFKVKCKNYKKLAEKSNSFKTIKSVTSLTIC